MSSLDSGKCCTPKVQSLIGKRLMKTTKKRIKSGRRRQWGAGGRTLRLAIVHERPSTGKITSSRAAIILKVGLWVTYLISTILRQFFDGPHSFEFMMQA